MSRGSITSKGRRAGKSRWVEGLGRAGLVSRGILYAVIGVIAIRIATGGGGPKADNQGAVAAIARQPFGRVLVAALALGLLGHAVWRLAQGALDRDDEGDDAQSLAKRGGQVVRGLWYAALAVVTGSKLFGPAGGGGGGKSEDKATSGVLGLPLGRYLVYAGALAFLGAALFNLYRAVTTDFEKHLRKGKMSDFEKAATKAIGILGHLARFVVWTLVALFLGRAAWQFDPQEAVGLDGALRKLAGQPYGSALLLAVAIGLLCYSLYCFAQARYRDV